ncbi:MAG: hypothetical protein KGI25_03700 [Thaumarchaeota archaeon]|nr:hypothetical protein [Nitrososphaerota archaeon]
MSEKMLLQDVATEKQIENENQELTLVPTTDDISILISTLDSKEDEIREINNNNNNNLIKLNIKNEILQLFIKNISKLKGEYVNPESGIVSLIVEFNKNFEEQQHSTTSLLYDGREPRLDVLKKLEKISHAATNDNRFPEFHKESLKKIIRDAVGSLDERTMKKYLKCLRGFVEATTGKKLTYYSAYDLTGFSHTIQEKLDQMGR